ncbi:MAG: universal stress protein UspA [Blastopirellula sp.]|nr:MAG: universal stress protein UspA [Blastopirellula sp.]
MNWLPKKNVVVPIDFSEQSMQAVSLALQMTEETSDIHIIHVLPPLMVAEPGVVWDEIDDQSRIKHAKEAITDELSGEQFQGVNLVVKIGDPGHAVADLARDVCAELIVMPSHGRTGLAHILIGSVTERVVRMAHCPVLVLRD